MARRAAPAGSRLFLLNKYFWIGVLVLAAVGFLVYYAVDDLLMPSYTRQGVTVTVPDVRNRSYEEAARVLRTSGLEAERIVERYNPRVERDAVIEQTPGPDAEVKPGRRVFLRVNSGKVPMVLVPYVGDLSLREAENRLKAAGLRVENILPDTIPSPYPNTITRQFPTSGDSLGRGAGVTLWYSTGFGAGYVEVPNVTGFSVGDAEAQLLNLKLRPVVVAGEGTEDVSGRRVLRQSRDAGSQVREGTEVRLFLEEAEQPAEADVLPDEVDIPAAMEQQ